MFDSCRIIAVSCQKFNLGYLLCVDVKVYNKKF